MFPTLCLVLLFWALPPVTSEKTGEIGTIACTTTGPGSPFPVLSSPSDFSLRFSPVLLEGTAKEGEQSLFDSDENSHDHALSTAHSQW